MTIQPAGPQSFKGVGCQAEKQRAELQRRREELQAVEAHGSSFARLSWSVAGVPFSGSLVPGREGRGTGEEDGGGARFHAASGRAHEECKLSEGAAFLRRATEMGRAAAGGTLALRILHCAADTLPCQFVFACDCTCV